MIIRAKKHFTLYGWHNRGDVFEVQDYEGKRLIELGSAEEVKQDHKHMETKPEIKEPEKPIDESEPITKPKAVKKRKVYKRKK